MDSIHIVPVPQRILVGIAHYAYGILGDDIEPFACQRVRRSRSVLGVVGRANLVNYYAWVKTWVAARILLPQFFTKLPDTSNFAIMSVPSFARV